MLFLSLSSSHPTRDLLHWALRFQNGKKKGDGRINAADALPHERQTAAVGPGVAFATIGCGMTLTGDVDSDPPAGDS
jgi:hypothetical protein